MLSETLEPEKDSRISAPTSASTTRRRKDPTSSCSIRTRHFELRAGVVDAVEIPQILRGRILDGFDGYVGLGFADSDIKESRRAMPRRWGVDLTYRF